MHHDIHHPFPPAAEAARKALEAEQAKQAAELQQLEDAAYETTPEVEVVSEAQAQEAVEQAVEATPIPSAEEILKNIPKNIKFEAAWPIAAHIGDIRIEIGERRPNLAREIAGSHRERIERFGNNYEDLIVSEYDEAFSNVRPGLYRSHVTIHDDHYVLAVVYFENPKNEKVAGKIAFAKTIARMPLPKKVAAVVAEEVAEVA